MAQRLRCLNPQITSDMAIQLGRNGTTISLVYGAETNLIEHCQQCLSVLCFEYLQDFFSRPYWKPLWIIQEVAVASRVHVLCGPAKITLDRLTTALDRCRKSRTWGLQMDVAYEYCQRVMEFRSFHENDTTLTLIKAIAMSQNFLSTDPRYKVFALLGVSSDGADLIARPNYQQLGDVIFRTMTRSLI